MKTDNGGNKFSLIWWIDYVVFVVWAVIFFEKRLIWYSKGRASRELILAFDRVHVYSAFQTSIVSIFSLHRVVFTEIKFESDTRAVRRFRLHWHDDNEKKNE